MQTYNTLANTFKRSWRYKSKIRVMIMLCCGMVYFNCAAVTITVLNGNDNGTGSLRQAITLAQNGDVINFSGPIVVQLSSGSLYVDKSISITGMQGVRITRVFNAPPFRLLFIDNISPRTGLVSISNIIFSDGNSGFGSAIRNAYPFLEIFNCTFENNTGNAFSSSAVSQYFEIRNCTFRNNNNSGFEIIAGTATIIACDFFNNGISGEGSAIFANGGGINLQRCTIRGNKGGGIGVLASTANIINCAITGNRATTSGGGIFLGAAGVVNLHSSTISGNMAPTGGASRLAGNSIINATNSILWGNSTELSLEAGSTANITYSIVQGGFTGTGNINANPAFVTPVSNADPNPQQGGNFALTSCSPAINAGTSANAPAIDINGIARPQLGGFDMGAFESASAASTGIIYVMPSAMGNNSGNSWTNAFTTLHAALAFAGQCPLVKQVWVAKGTYTPTTNTNRDSAFAMRNYLAIYGGFAGTETQLIQRNWRLNPTILSGDIGEVGNRADNSHNVISNINNSLDNTAILDGFVIANGQANKGEYARARGGGMYNFNASPLVRNCIFTGNFASAYGGAVFNQGAASTPTFINCVFSGNQAQFGGGVYNESAQTRIINSTFSSNQITGNGGGIYSYGNPKATVSNSIFWGNAINGVFTAGIDNSTPIEVTHSLVQGGYAGTGNLSTDPVFVSQAPIGLGQLGDLRLLFCSPARNTGSNAALPAGTNFDLAGYNRIVFTNVDMGAYESQTNAGATIYLDASAIGNNEGTSWANAFTSLEAALNDLNLCNGGSALTLQIAAGTYPVPAGKTIIIDNLNAVVLGGYPTGGGTRNVAANPVIFKGNVQVVKNMTIDGVRVVAP